MPKRKRVSSIQAVSKKRRHNKTPCPQLPQELWDRVIDFSIDVDPVLGVLPQEVHQPFTSPFMRLNRACRERLLSIIASLTWIEIKSHNHGHADFVHALAKCFPVVDPFWVTSLLQTKRNSRIVLEFSHRIVRRSTRQYAHDTKSFVVPYAFSFMLRMLSEIDFLHLYYEDAGHIIVRGCGVPGARLRDLELLLSLRLAKNVFLETEFEHSLGAPPLTILEIKDPLSLIIAQRNFVEDKLNDQANTVPRVQRMLVYLYMNKDLDAYTAEYLDPPIMWATSPSRLDQPDWLSNLALNKHLRIVWVSYKSEAAAFRYFKELLQTDKEWTIWQAPFLTDRFDRWIVEPPFTYYGLPDDDMSDFFHDAGTAITTFLKLVGWPEEPDLQTNSSTSVPVSPMYAKLRSRVSLFQCASRLRPQNEVYTQDHLNAKEDLSRLFPNVTEAWKDHQVHYYTDTEGRDCTYFNTPNIKRPYGILARMHRAQQIIKNLQSEANKVTVASDNDVSVNDT